MFAGEPSQPSQPAQADGGDQPELEDLMSALVRLTLPETPLPMRVKPAANRVMIWTEKEAVRKQVMNIEL